jgi:hypothetical protein
MIGIDAPSTASPDRCSWPGADLVAVVERAVDLVIAVALESGTEAPISQQHLAATVAATEPTTQATRKLSLLQVEGGGRDRSAVPATRSGTERSAD